MPTEHTDQMHAQLETLLPAEWDRLVRLCATLSGNPDAAEDLAQETSIEAWRQAGRLRDPDAHRAWLGGIARNVCLRWRRGLAREIDRRERLAAHLARSPVTRGEMDIAVETGEMTTLLDRVLEQLPEPTRNVLVLRYLEERSHAEIADQLGLSVGAVMVRAHRGRRALKRALARPGPHADVETLDPAEHAGWRQTRIWCPFCGRHHLKTRIDPDTGLLFACCTGSCTDGGAIIGGTATHPDTARLTSIKSIISRELVHLHDYYRDALAAGGNRCAVCGRFLPLASWHPDQPPSCSTAQPHGIHMRCGHCGNESRASLWHLLIDTPEAQRFWRRHPRMEALPAREVEHDGAAALVSGFASVNGSERLEIVSDRASFALLHIDGDAGR